MYFGLNSLNDIFLLNRDVKRTLLTVVVLRGKKTILKTKH